MYKLLHSTNAGELSKEVANYLHKGWRLYSAPIIITMPDPGNTAYTHETITTHYQAVTKIKEGNTG